jgi:signal transduction histidine kinase
MLDINERKLFEQNLQEQNQQLTKINQELDRFVYSVSHNLRAPLTSILGLINLVKIDGKDSNIDTYLKLMEKSIHKLDETIHEINDYSRNARLDIHLNEIDFPKMLGEVIENHRYMEGAEKISIVPDLQISAPFFSDESRLKVIVNNLLSNAIKYHDLNKANPLIQIYVTVSPVEATIIFKDNGIGMQPDLTDKIFTMFFRGSEKSTGSGLGLYIVKETVIKLKGTISVTSALHEGSIFTVQLPNLSAENI